MVDSEGSFLAVERMALSGVLRFLGLLVVEPQLYQMWYQLPLLLRLVVVLLDDALKKTKLLHRHHRLLEVADLMKMVRLAFVLTKRAEF